MSLHGSVLTQVAQLAEQVTVNHWVVGSNPTLGAMSYIPPNNNDFCVDCSVDTILIGEYYMLHHFVWQQTGLGRYDGMLCISCVEKRIGRKLTSKDFSDFPVNSTPLFRSSLLAERLSS